MYNYFTIQSSCTKDEIRVLYNSQVTEKKFVYNNRKFSTN